MAQAPIENEFLRLICVGELIFRPFELRTAAPPPQIQELGFTGVMTAKRATNELHFAFQCRSTWSRLSLQHFLRDAEKVREEAGLLPLLVVPYLSERHIDALDEAGVSGLDLAGNGLLRADPTIYVRNSGARSKYKLRAPPAYVYRGWKVTSLVPRLFLCEPSFPTVRSVLDGCHARIMRYGSGPPPLTLPTISKALSQLEDDLAIARKGRTLRALHPERLLDGLARAYRPPTPTAHFRGRTSLSSDKAWCVIQALRPDLRAIVTGRGSASRYTALVGVDPLQLYVSNASQVAAALDAQPSEAFPNLELFETDEEGVYFDAQADDHANWASIIQTYLELTIGGAREVEAAKVLRERILRRSGP